MIPIPIVSELSHIWMLLQVFFFSALRRRLRRWSVGRTWGPGWCGCAASRFCLESRDSHLSGLPLCGILPPPVCSENLALRGVGATSRRPVRIDKCKPCRRFGILFQEGKEGLKEFNKGGRCFLRWI